jgi:hypothetical protein
MIVSTRVGGIILNTHLALTISPDITASRTLPTAARVPGYALHFSMTSLAIWSRVESWVSRSFPFRELVAELRRFCARNPRSSPTSPALAATPTNPPVRPPNGVLGEVEEADESESSQAAAR